ncbi:MAG: Gldg family protein [Bradymonadia bacterium]
MSSIRTVARKEIRAYFQSPVALIFLGIFLLVTLLSFFVWDTFFARNIADVRPLFSRLPLLMILLTGAITMRAWSEEQKMGTLEVLFTLPLRTRDLVLGKFVAGMALVGLALLLTLPLPITVSMLGDLDWGPVFGGYVAALLLASTYMALGLWISALTDNQLVALMTTLVACGVLYLIGAPALVDLVSNQTGDVLRAMGTGSRFASIERGVLDLRDLAYYLSLTTFFLLLNGVFLERKRLDQGPTDRANPRVALTLTTLLAGVNVLLLNMWLAPVNQIRVDLTANGDYSISDVTENMLAGLDEQLVISGYFSARTHPKLAPLVPRVKDLLQEYAIHGGGNVVVEFADPTTDEALEAEIGDQYGIRSEPLPVSDRHQKSVVNSFFHILVRYGDEYEVLSFPQLIEVYADDRNEVQIRLRNLEYDVTRSIKKITQEFQSLEGVFAQMKTGAKLTAYISPDSLPDQLKKVPEQLQKVVDELKEKAGGKFSYELKDPSKDQALAQAINMKYGFRPMSMDFLSEQTFYMYLLIDVEGRLEQIFLQGDIKEADLRTAVESALKRATPGFMKTVALLTEQPEQPQNNPMLPPQMQPPPKQADYRAIEQLFSQEFQVKRIEAKEGQIDSDVDVLVVAKPGQLTPKQQYAIDQFLMRGGSVVALAGYDVNFDPQKGFTAAAENPRLLKLLAHYGVGVEPAFAMDPQSAQIPLPVQKEVRGFQIRAIEMVSYPFFPDIRRDGFNEGHVALAGLANVALTWASPLKLAETLPEGLQREVLLETSSGSWMRKSMVMMPKTTDEQGRPVFEVEGDIGRRPVAVTLVGQITSYFNDKPSPLVDLSGAPPAEGQQIDRSGQTIKQSVGDARLVVVGSSTFASDIITGLAQDASGGVYRGNFQFLRNIVDWALADTDLLQIRSAGAFARTLDPMEDSERTTWEVSNYGFALIALALVVFLAAGTRRRRPLTLAPERK